MHVTFYQYFDRLFGSWIINAFLKQIDYGLFFLFLSSRLFAAWNAMPYFFQKIE